MAHNVTAHGLGMGQTLRFLRSRTLRLCAVFACTGLWAMSASAQIYDTTQTGALGAGTSCDAGAFLDRTITVVDAFNVDDLDLGILITHNWRGDVPITLIDPGGLSVELVPSDINTGDENNYNIRLDDQAAVIVNTGTHNSNDGTVAPPYENLVRPSVAGSLAQFTGRPAQGDWTVRLCDAFPGADNGTFQNATLYFSSVNDADLSLSISADNTAPTIGGGVVITVQITNDGPQNASVASVNVPVAAGLTFISAAGDGSYNELTGFWTPTAPLSNGATQTLFINATVDPIGPYDISAEITASDRPDPDSIPGNNDPSEDDQDALSLSPVPPTTAPPLTCPAGQREPLIWGPPGSPNGWDAGTLSGSYTVATRPVTFSLTGDTSGLIPRNGVQTPVSGTEFTGGAPAGDYSVITYVDFDNTSQFIQWNIDIGTPGEGVGELQFDIFDVDLGVWTDRVRIQGFLNGNLVSAIITPSTNNTVNGDTLTGTGGAASTQNSGNATVTFLSQIDRVELRYDNASPTADPEPQVFSIFANFVACPPPAANISAQKTVEVFDPAGAGLYAIPGQDMLYRITVENSASATATANDIRLRDILPDTVSFVSASVSGLTGASFGSPALPPSNTDCAGGACIINVTGGSLGVGETGELVIRATLK